MITLLYFVLTYTLLGSLVYLYAQKQIDEEMTQFKTELFLRLGFIFKPVISIIILIDGTLIPYIKFKKTIQYIKFHYGLIMMIPFISKEDKNIAKNKRDKMVQLITDVYYNWEEGDLDEK